MTLLPPNMVNASTVIETFDAVADFTVSGGTIEADATNYHDGGAVKLTPTTPGEDVTATKLGTSVDISSVDAVRLWVHLDEDRPAGTGVGLTLTTVNVTPRETFSYWWTGNMYAGWNVLPIGIDDMSVSNGASRDDPVIKIQVTVSPAAGLATAITFDSLELVDSIPAVMFAFDDQFAEVYEVAYPILAAADMRGTIYTIRERADTSGRMTTAQLQELNDIGWAIANHTATHPFLPDLGAQADIESELRECRDWLLDINCTRAARMVAYPGGEFDATTLAAMDATGMLCGRTIGGQFRYLPHADIRRVGGISLNAGCPLATAQSYVDQAINAGVVADFYTHRLLDESDDTNYSISEFQSLVDYVATAGVAVLTIDEWYQYTDFVVARDRTWNYLRRTHMHPDTNPLLRKG